MLYNMAMNVVNYLKETYGYSVPIFLRNIRIGRKSKTAIRKELSRAVQKGEIVRRSNGVYYLEEDTDIPRTVSFEDIIEKKFIKDDFGFPGLDLDVYGYYSGLTFKHQIGLTQQVPAVLEITTNNTSCKRIYQSAGYRAILRKGKIEINRFNYKALQFFECVNSLDYEEIKENKELLFDYIRKNLTDNDFEKYSNYLTAKSLEALMECELTYAFRQRKRII